MPDLPEGHRRYVYHDPRPADGKWRTDPSIHAPDGEVTLSLGETSMPYAILGHGSGTTGGGSATPTVVTTFSAWKSVVEGSGARVVSVPDTVGWLDGGGVAVNIDNPALTILGGKVKRAQLQVRTSNVWIDQFRSWPGDQVNAPDDVDGLSILGPTSGFIEKIAVSRSSFFFASDVSFTILRDVRDSTVQDCMIGLGLYRSAHSEANQVGEDHSYAFNASCPGAPFSPWGKRLTVFRNLFLHSDGRMPQTWEFDGIDFVNNVMYNPGRNGFVGNPRGMNAVNNILRSGPQSTSNAKKIWRGTQHDGQPWFPNSVWLSGNVADGFTATFSYGSGTKRTSSYGTVSVTPFTPNLDTVLNAVGPTNRNSLEAALVAHVRARTSPGFYNGQGFPAPNPVWP